MTDLNTWIWMEGRVLAAADARVSVLDRGFLYGDSVYEVMRTFSGVPFRMAAHLDRLERSAAGLMLKLPPRSAIEQAVHEVSAAAPAGTGDLYLRIVVTRGAGELGLDPALADAPTLVLVARAVHPPPPEAYRDGVTIILSARSRTTPTLKTGNYLDSVMAVREARQAGAHEALVRDAVGRVTEGSSSNLFLVSGGRLVTPPITAGLLPGITRAAIIEVARADGIAVDEVPLWPSDVLGADEIFISSSIRGVLPVVRCDAQLIGDGRPGPVTRRVMALYERATRTPG